MIETEAETEPQTQPQPTLSRQRVAFEVGSRLRELNTIFSSMRRRGATEPTTRERERILKLRDEIRVLRRGETF